MYPLQPLSSQSRAATVRATVTCNGLTSAHQAPGSASDGCVTEPKGKRALYLDPQQPFVRMAPPRLYVKPSVQSSQSLMASESLEDRGLTRKHRLPAGSTLMQLRGHGRPGRSLPSYKPACLLSPRLSQGESRCPWALQPSDPRILLFSKINPPHGSLGWEARGGGGPHRPAAPRLSHSPGWTARMVGTLPRFPDAAKDVRVAGDTSLWGVLPERQGQPGAEVSLLCPTALCSDISGPSGSPERVRALGGMAPCFHPPHTTKPFAGFQESHSQVPPLHPRRLSSGLAEARTPGQRHTSTGGAAVLPKISGCSRKESSGGLSSQQPANGKMPVDRPFFIPAMSTDFFRVPLSSRFHRVLSTRLWTALIHSDSPFRHFIPSFTV